MKLYELPWEESDRLEKDREKREEYAEYLYELERDRKMEENWENGKLA